MDQRSIANVQPESLAAISQESIDGLKPDFWQHVTPNQVTSACCTVSVFAFR